MDLGSNKSTAVGLIERAAREVEQYLQIKLDESRVNGSVTIESLLHELEKKRSIIQYDEDIFLCFRWVFIQDPFCNLFIG